MKKLVGVTGCFLMLCNVIMYMILPSVPQTDASPENSYSEPFVSAPPVDTKTTEVYTLKEYNGRIAVFRGTSDVPYIETDVQIADLPQVDINMLKTGISVQTTSELNRLLEDYCS